MKIAIRADASIVMGIGHIMRCITLANELKRSGAETRFICRENDGHMATHILKSGHDVALLRSSSGRIEIDRPHARREDWLCVSEKQDAKQTIGLLDGLRPDWLVVDHYGIGANWHGFMRPCVGKIMVIDDLSDRELDCDLLLNQNYGRKDSEYQSLVPPTCKKLLGAHYALLRPQFAAYRNMAQDKRAKYKGINKILVSMGGTDHHNVTTLALSAIEEISRLNGITVDVVLGKNTPHIKSIMSLVKSYKTDIRIHSDVTNMAEMIYQADLSIGTAGSTSWERCCLGLPTLMIIVAENQQAVAHHLAEAGAALNMGWYEQIDKDDMICQIERIIADRKLYCKIADRAFETADGLGTKRVVDNILGTGCRQINRQSGTNTDK